jgi:hypothetical protein
VRPVAVNIVKLAAHGERHQARDAARAAAVDLGERLAKSSWTEAEDNWTPEAMISNVRRG